MKQRKKKMKTIKSLSDKLPRKVRGKHQCQALDMNGNRCPKMATIEQYYHGDNELYYSYNDDVPQWIIVKLCEKHKT